MTGDRALLRRAILTDPICNNIGDADACIADLLEAERGCVAGLLAPQGRSLSRKTALRMACSGSN